MGLTPSERAEKIADMLHLPNIQRQFIAEQISEAEREAYAEGGAVDNIIYHKKSWVEGFTAARAKAKGIAGEDARGKKRLCSEKFDGHDDRHCPVCEDMRDEADILEQRIEAMEP